jgi:glycosyltransferase involved in cell wall biosynthesis
VKIGLVYDALYPFNIGGAERRYAEIAARLKDRHEVHLISWQHWPGSALRESGGIVYHGVGPARNFYGDDGKRTVREASEFALRLLPALCRERFDVLDCSATPYVPLYAAYAGARMRGTPLVATWHEFWGDHWLDYLRERPLTARLSRLVEAGCVPFCDAVVAVSSFTAQRLRRRLPRSRPLEVIENGIDIAAIQSAPAADSGFDVVYVGRLIEDKRLEVLIRAAAILKHRFPSLSCAIIGNGPERRRLEDLTASLRLSDCVRFLGNVDVTPTYGMLKASKVFALPSIREGFAISVLEAQAAGLVPVVARAPHSAAPFLVDHQRTGLICECDPESFATAIGQLLADGASRQKLSAAAIGAAAAYDWNVISHRMEEVYRKVARRDGVREASLAASAVQESPKAVA